MLFCSRVLILFWGLLVLSGAAMAKTDGCTAKGCHGGIESILPPQMPMMGLILQNGQRHGDYDGCIICHGGDPGSRKKEKAHSGIPKSLSRVTGPRDFYPNPGDLTVVDHTCGACHIGYGDRVRKSLMQTQAGMIQGNFSAWGIQRGLGTIPLGNQSLRDEDGPVPVGATPAYDDRMAGFQRAFPLVFPKAMDGLPNPSVKEIQEQPALAGALHQRRRCQRCHINGSGAQRPGDFRGIGCSACHIPYGPDGRYRGKDPSISRDRPGKPLRHRIQGNQKTGGIPVQTCRSCHNRGKRIGTSLGGFMETPHRGGFGPRGTLQPQRHGRFYRYLGPDLHHSPDPRNRSAAGFLCQDCHTTMDVHGDGNLATTTLGQVEIECTDCHGTPNAFPWELPLGYGDGMEGTGAVSPRGVADRKLADHQRFGTAHDPGDGFLVSARGNPLGNGVKLGDRALLHLAGGGSRSIPLLKDLSPGWGEKNPGAGVAMGAVSGHLERMECYACHSSWAPQVYGRHVKVDLSQVDDSAVDWVDNAPPADPRGRIQETVSFTRGSAPALGVNGEGRISPLIPLNQLVHTVVGPGGDGLARSRMAANPREAEDLGLARAPLALDTAPVQPHTTGPARSCESCHAHPGALGLGSVPAGAFDWTRLTGKDGVQMVTVGSHWPLSRALTPAETQKILRTGVCSGCHHTMADAQFWKRVSTDGVPDTKTHQALMEKLLRAGAGK